VNYQMPLLQTCLIVKRLHSGISSGMGGLSGHRQTAGDEVLGCHAPEDGLLMTKTTISSVFSGVFANLHGDFCESARRVCGFARQIF